MKKTLCSACKTYFTSITEFDTHRVGQFGVDRRCMTHEEMVKAGFTSAPHRITDEAGTPNRVVWGRPMSDQAKKRLTELNRR
jgi:hypothetical protein